MLAGQLERTAEIEIEDLDDLHACRTALEVELAEIAEQRAQRAAWEQAVLRRVAASDAARCAAEAVNAAEAALDVFGDPDLDGARRRSRTAAAQLDKRRHEEERAKDRLRLASSELELLIAEHQRMTERWEARQRGVERVLAWGDAATLIRSIAQQRADGLRPELSSVTATHLCAMSSGEFNRVRIGEDFAVEVHTGGVWRSLNDLSGGERDMVSLALRLALSEVISRRRGINCGVVVLDEVLGSQDETRRGSVLGALLAARERFGQVLAISHVGGIDEIADVVIRVDPAGNNHAATVRVESAP